MEADECGENVKRAVVETMTDILEVLVSGEEDIVREETETEGTDPEAGKRQREEGFDFTGLPVADASLHNREAEKMADTIWSNPEEDAGKGMDAVQARHIDFVRINDGMLREVGEMDEGRGGGGGGVDGVGEEEVEEKEGIGPSMPPPASTEAAIMEQAREDAATPLGDGSRYLMWKDKPHETAANAVDVSAAEPGEHPSTSIIARDELPTGQSLSPGTWRLCLGKKRKLEEKQGPEDGAQEAQPTFEGCGGGRGAPTRVLQNWHSSTETTKDGKMRGATVKKRGDGTRDVSLNINGKQYDLGINVPTNDIPLYKDIALVVCNPNKTDFGKHHFLFQDSPQKACIHYETTRVCLILERENAARKALETEAASPRASQTSRPHERTQNQPHQRPLHNQAPTSSARAPRPISQVTHGSSAVARGIQQHAHAGGQGPAHSANQPSSNSPLRSLSTAGGGTHQMRAIYAQSAVNLQSARSFLEGVYKRESQEMVWSTEEEMNTRWRLPVQDALDSMENVTKDRIAVLHDTEKKTGFAVNKSKDENRLASCQTMRKLLCDFDMQLLSRVQMQKAVLNAAQAFADDADSQEKVNELRRSMESLDRVKKIYLNHLFEFLKSSVWAEILPLVRDSV